MAITGFVDIRLLLKGLKCPVATRHLLSSSTWWNIDRRFRRQLWMIIRYSIFTGCIDCDYFSIDVLPRTTENRSTCSSSGFAERARRMAITSSTPGSVSMIMRLVGIIVFVTAARSVLNYIYSIQAVIMPARQCRQSYNSCRIFFLAVDHHDKVKHAPLRRCDVLDD